MVRDQPCSSLTSATIHGFMVDSILIGWADISLQGNELYVLDRHNHEHVLDRESLR